MPGAGLLHTSAGKDCSGVSLPKHENPNEKPAQPTTESSGLHVEDENGMQQKSVAPGAGVPALHTSDESKFSGRSPGAHE